LAIPVWQWGYSPFGADLVNAYEAKPTTIANNFKTELWAWLGLPETGGANPNQIVAPDLFIFRPRLAAS
jgi:hypothetical protein